MDVPEGTRGALQELSVSTLAASPEDDAPSTVAVDFIPKDKTSRCFHRPLESSLRLRPRLVPANPKVFVHRCGTYGLSTIPNGASTLRSFPLITSRLPVTVPSEDGTTTQSSCPLVVVHRFPFHSCHLFRKRCDTSGRCSRPSTSRLSSSSESVPSVASCLTANARCSLGLPLFRPTSFPGFRSITRVMVPNPCQLHRPHDSVLIRFPKDSHLSCVGVVSPFAEAKETRASSRSRPRGLPPQPQTPLRVNSNRCRWPM